MVPGAAHHLARREGTEVVEAILDPHQASVSGGVEVQLDSIVQAFHSRHVQLEGEESRAPFSDRTGGSRAQRARASAGIYDDGSTEGGALSRGPHARGHADGSSPPRDRIGDEDAFEDIGAQRARMFEQELIERRATDSQTESSASGKSVQRDTVARTARGDENSLSHGAGSGAERGLQKALSFEQSDAAWREEFATEFRAGERRAVKYAYAIAAPGQLRRCCRARRPPADDEDVPDHRSPIRMNR